MNTAARTRRQEDGTRASVTLQGELLEYKVHHVREPLITEKRGLVTDFSNGARLRMIKNFHRIDLNAKPRPLFMTLTYPDELATPTLAERNKHRQTMARHLERLTGNPVPAAWRVEWVPRKSGEHVELPCPHWHWLIFRHGFIPYEEVNRLWRQTIGWQGYCRTEIKGVDARGVVQMYMAKYISKDAVSPSLVYAAYHNSTGRSYGWLRRSAIPWAEREQLNTIPDEARRELTRMASEVRLHVQEQNEVSFSLYGSDAKAGEKILRSHTLTSG